VINEYTKVDTALMIWLPVTNKYIFGWGAGHTYGDPLILPYGSLNELPFARLFSSNTVVILNRSTDTAAPYYQGDYTVGFWDGFDPGEANYLDIGYQSVMVWKDGVIKTRVNKTTPCTDLKHWWFALQIRSPVTGPATYLPHSPACGTVDDVPYP